MAITDPSDEIQAFMTDVAREYLARAINGELAYQLIGFSAGRGGYNPLDPVKVIAVNTADVALADQVFPAVTGNTPFQVDRPFEQPSPSSLVMNCRLPSTLIASNADYGLGEVGVWAKILTSSVPAEVNLVFLFALAHFPIRAKTRRDVILFRVVTQL